MKNEENIKGNDPSPEIKRKIYYEPHLHHQAQLLWQKKVTKSTLANALYKLFVRN